MDTIALGRSIKAARHLKGMTQRNLEAETGFELWRIRAWEQGRSQPSALQLGTLASALGVTADHLLFGACPV